MVTLLTSKNNIHISIINKFEKHLKHIRTIMLLFAKSRFPRYFFRGFSTTAIKHQSSLVKLRKLQADFQCENGKPIWLKGGLSDRILYGTTVVLCYLGVLMTLACIYDNAKPSSWKDPTC